MPVSSVTDTIPSNAELQKATGSDELDQDDFLTLLVAQLEHQDPLNPMDSTEFTTQLAQFNSLEQLIKVNDQLTDLQSGQTALNNLQAASYIGKTVKAAGNVVEVADGNPAEIHFALSAPASGVYVTIYDAYGDYVTAIESGDMAAGDQTLEWDGRNESGATVADGLFTYEIQAVDGDQQAIAVEPYVIKAITGVRYESGNAVLMADHYPIALGDVKEIRE